MQISNEQIEKFRRSNTKFGLGSAVYEHVFPEAGEVMNGVKLSLATSKRAYKREELILTRYQIENASDREIEWDHTGELLYLQILCVKALESGVLHRAQYFGPIGKHYKRKLKPGQVIRYEFFLNDVLDAWKTGTYEIWIEELNQYGGDETRTTITSNVVRLRITEE